jgi:hypothetical protein
VGPRAFCGCPIQRVVIGTGTSVGVCAFQLCRSLVEVVIQEGAGPIDEDAFGGCGAWMFVKVPSDYSGCRQKALRQVIGRLELVGPNLCSALVAVLRPLLRPDAKIFGRDLTARCFGWFSRKIQPLS